MPNKKPTIDDYIDAVLARDRGMLYSEVLETYGITPNQFARAVNRDLTELINAAGGDAKKTLSEITGDGSRIRELFRMEEEFLQQQYMIVNGLKAGKQRRIYEGTYSHPENVEFLVYFALTYKNLELSSPNRDEVVEGIKGLSRDLKTYLHSIRLAGLMIQGFGKGEQDSPLAVLKAFDMAYQRKTGNSSLFDQTQQHYLMFDNQNRLIR